MRAGVACRNRAENSRPDEVEAICLTYNGLQILSSKDGLLSIGRFNFTVLNLFYQFVE